MSSSALWKKDGNTLVGLNNECYELLPHEFWYVVPTRTEYSSQERRRVRPLEFAFVLHNAFIARGLLASPTVLAHGIEPKPMKGGAAAEAELLLERIRLETFPDKPSRLRCYFLNLDRTTAEYRMQGILRGNNTLVRCYVVMNDARVHFADCGIYEHLEGRSDDTTLARTYWETFQPQGDEQVKRLEVLADSALYFPDWETFPTIPIESLVNWTRDNPPDGIDG